MNKNLALPFFDLHKIIQNIGNLIYGLAPGWQDQNTVLLPSIQNTYVAFGNVCLKKATDLVFVDPTSHRVIKLLEYPSGLTVKAAVLYICGVILVMDKVISHFTIRDDQ
jgi:hypothetical protein